MEIKDLKPQGMWQCFIDICQVPRPSKKEEKIINFLLDFGKKHNIETSRDKVGNVLMKKSASKGYEKHPCVILQSHMDMVCEKNSDTTHDFDKDPIQPYIDGEWLKARGTTLGADNGIGMAAAMAVLLDKDLKHPELECLFTVDEETGLTGAFALENNFLSGKKLINLDSEDDGELFIGCAGGIDTLVSFGYSTEIAPKELFYAKISVKGLLGGHSGDDIDKNRACANKILNRFLWNIAKKTKLVLSEIDGGNLRNAIAREAFAIIGVDMNFKEKLAIAINHYSVDVRAEYAATEPNMSVSIDTVAAPQTIIDGQMVKRLFNALYACPHGIIRMSDDMHGLVETSTNLASVKMADGEIRISTSQRSSVASAKTDIANMVESVFVMAGANVEHSDGYPGWKPNPNSELAKIVDDTYKNLFRQEMKIRAIHAGLECGLFSEKYPAMDMVSFGPTMRGVHSPDERLHIADTEKFWTLLVKVLENL
ncbi:MAG: aminoacyl-histidine dipeptidase [Prevotellaceae bacterium]|jgi:dipeptidase D|nr:aminoacyl-histidine dipeptidase [Prevotellaceae bacterium]